MIFACIYIERPAPSLDEYAEIARLVDEAAAQDNLEDELDIDTKLRGLTYLTHYI